MVAKQELPGQIEPISDTGRLSTPLWFSWFTFVRDTLATFLGAWRTTFVPVVTSTAGGPPTVTTTCRYVQNGRTVSVALVINITALNGASGTLVASLPVTPAVRPAVLTGREFAVTGKALQGAIQLSGINVGVLNYDNSSPIAVGAQLVLNGTYEV